MSGCERIQCHCVYVHTVALNALEVRLVKLDLLPTLCVSVCRAVWLS